MSLPKNYKASNSERVWLDKITKKLCFSIHMHKIKYGSRHGLGNGSWSRLKRVIHLIMSESGCIPLLVGIA